LDTVVVPFSIGVSVVVVPLPKLVVTDKMDLAIFRVVSSNGGGLQLKIGRLIKTRKKIEKRIFSNDFSLIFSLQ
jgi:hypothetical protein